MALWCYSRRLGGGRGVGGSMGLQQGVGWGEGLYGVTSGDGAGGRRADSSMGLHQGVGRWGGRWL